MLQGLPTDPAAARFVYDDVHHFVRALELSNAGDAVETLQAEYFDPATPGLRAYTAKCGLTARGLAEAIRQRPREYAALRDLPDQLAAQESKFREAFGQLKGLVPEAVFPPTYFLIGEGRGLSSGAKEGQLISAERRPATEMAPLVTHELVHFQQAMAQGIEKYRAIYGPAMSLLALAIREGTAEFLAALTSGEPTQKALHAYGEAQEKQLWTRFCAEMNGRELGSWMKLGSDDAAAPQGLGYFVGFKIVEAFYEGAEDKAGAVQEILSVSDYAAFLERSGYARRFT